MIGVLRFKKLISYTKPINSYFFHVCNMENASTWQAPQRKDNSYITGLKVNNSLSPGKLVLLSFVKYLSNRPILSRSTLFPKMDVVFTGTCAVPLFTIVLTWVMQGIKA